MQLYIPKVGDEITLTEKVSVIIKEERRNEKFIKLATDAGIVDETIERYFKNRVYDLTYYDKLITLDKGLTLKFDRIYVRKGSSDEYNSITFCIDDKKIGKGRFFISLDDANKIKYEINEPVIKKVIPKLYRQYSITELDDLIKYEKVEPIYSLPVSFDNKKMFGLIETGFKEFLSDGHLNCHTEIDEILREGRLLSMSIGQSATDVWKMDFYLIQGQYVYSAKQTEREPYLEYLKKCYDLFYKHYDDSESKMSGFNTFLDVYEQIVFNNDSWSLSLYEYGFYDHPDFKYSALKSLLNDNIKSLKVDKNFEDIKKELTRCKRIENKRIKELAK